jgi:prepilin-type N-terminal cleavage/methylation domain-containing protein
MAGDSYTQNRAASARGVSLLELIIVVAIALILAAIIFPEFTRISYNIRLRNAATNISALMQRDRITAARQNAIYTVYMPTSGGKACIDLNNNSACDSGEPTITFNSTITPAAAAPTGGSGQPTAYVLVGDTGTTVYTNGTTLGFSTRGLPCSYSGGSCPTPPGGYFVYYLNDARGDGTTGWAAIVVTRTGRTKAYLWNGSAWY